MYMKLIDIVRNFLRSKRTGDWKLHLATLQNLLPYFAASGNNLYTKSVYLYLQKMWKLEHSNPGIYTKFMDGFHVVLRSDRYWTGLSPDLVIQQVLMKSLTKRVVWREDRVWQKHSDWYGACPDLFAQRSTMPCSNWLQLSMQQVNSIKICQRHVRQGT